MPDLTLLCPGTLRPAPDTDPATPPAAGARGRAPAPPEAFDTVLRRARVIEHWGDDDAVPLELPHERWLRRAARVPAGCTLEALTAHMDGVAAPALRLTPVHLRIARDHLVLTDPAQLALDAAEAAALAHTAAPVFEEQGLRLVADRAPGRWYLTGKGLPELTSRAWTLAVGRNVDAWSPSGDQARRWRKLVNEVQMLWHIDPVNERRADRGLPAVNGLWLDGAVAASLEAPSPFAEIRSDDPALAGLARLADAGPPTGGAVVQVLDDWRRHLRDPLADGGRTLRAAAAEAIERALAAGARRLTLVLTGERDGVVLSLSGGDGWKFWQRLAPDALSERAR